MSDLTDLEICKAIAEIEGLENYISENKRYCMTRDKSSTRIIRHVEYNPLTDDALCFRLVVKYKISIDHDECLCGKLVRASNNHWEYLGNICYDENTSINKAICLAIIEASQ